jgi:hypothetical protein
MARTKQTARRSALRLIIFEVTAGGSIVRQHVEPVFNGNRNTAIARALHVTHDIPVEVQRPESPWKVYDTRRSKTDVQHMTRNTSAEFVMTLLEIPVLAMEALDETAGISGIAPGLYGNVVIALSNNYVGNAAVDFNDIDRKSTRLNSSHRV